MPYKHLSSPCLPGYAVPIRSPLNAIQGIQSALAACDIIPSNGCDIYCGNYVFFAINGFVTQTENSGIRSAYQGEQVTVLRCGGIRPWMP